MQQYLLLLRRQVLNHLKQTDAAGKAIPFIENVHLGVARRKGVAKHHRDKSAQQRNE